MATIAELNIRLGLLTKEFDRELRGVERKMKQAGDQLSSLGSDLTAAVSLPLVGLGFAAIKSAGDIEALRLALTTTMTDAGASTAEVTAELEALRVAAQEPSLDFEQAIKASVRLQNVGFSAEEARTAIIGMAKAIALSGGTAEDLNEVTNQFSQMIGKGKVFQDDIKILTGRMPKLAKIMKDTFGTTTAEGINELGISSREFVERVTAEMNKLPQVASGIKNSLVNLFVGLQLEAARFGEEINKAFSIEGVGEGLLGIIRAIGDAFAGLSDGSKKIIIGMAALAAAAGPVLFIFGKMVAFLAPIRTGFLAAAEAVRVLNGRMVAANVAQLQMATGYRAVTVASTTAATAQQGVSLAFAATAASAERNKVAGLLMAKSMDNAKAAAASGVGSFTGFSAAIQRATAAFAALNIAQKALLVGGIIAAVAAIAIVYNELTDELTAAEKAQIAVSKVTQQAGEDISSERTKVVELAGVLKDQNATREEQKRALEALQAVAPEYFSNLDAEKVKVADVDKAVNLYIDSLLRAAKAKRAFARLEELDKLRETMVEMSEPSTWQTIVNGFKSGGNSINFTALQANSLGKNFVQLKEEIEAEEKAMREVIKANGDFVSTAGGATTASATIATGAKKSTEAQKEAARQAELYKDALASIAAVAQKGDVLGAGVMSEQAREIESQIERLLENGFKPYSKQIEHLREMLRQLREDAGKGFETPNVTQQTLGFSLDTPTIPALEIPIKIASIEGPKIDLPLLEIPKAIVSIDATEAINSINSLKDAVVGYVGGTSEFQTTTNAQREIFANLANDTITATEAFNQFGEIIRQRSAGTAEMMQIGADAVTSFGESIAAMIESSDSSFQGFVGTVLRGAAEIVGALIRIFVAKMMANTAFFAANPIVAAALAGTIAAIATAVFKKGISAAKLAKGGVVDRPTLALVGEYAGASNNPEIITPENKLTNVFTDVLNSFDFPVPEIPEQKTIKQEPLPAPVVNIRLGNVAPTSSDTPPVKGNVFSAISKNVLDAVNNTDSTNTTFKILEQGFKSVSNEFSEIFESSDIRRVEREQTTVGGEFQYVENNTTSTFRLLERGFESIANEFSQTFERLDVRNVEGAEKTTTGGEFQYVEKNTASTFKEVLSGFKIPEINIFQSGEPAPADQPGRGISRTFRSIAQSVVMPEMQSIQAPAVNVTNRDVFTGIAPVKIESEEDSQLTAVVRGDDLLFLVDKAAVRRGRTK